MKHLLKVNTLLYLMLSFVFVISTNIEGVAQNKELKKELKKKAVKEARKAAKGLKKKGWSVPPGSLPMEKMLEKSMLMELDVDDEGYTIFIIGEATSRGGTKIAAKKQAVDVAKTELAGMIATQVEELVSSNIANTDLGQDDVESITETLANSKNRISQKLSRVIPLVEIYRETENGNYECSVRIGYNQEKAMDEAKEIIKKDLRKKLDKNEEDLEKLLDW